MESSWDELFGHWGMKVFLWVPQKKNLMGYETFTPLQNFAKDQVGKNGLEHPASVPFLITPLLLLSIASLRVLI